MSEAMIAQAAGQLRQALVQMKKSETWKQIVEPRDAVFARFQPIFQPAYIPNLAEDELRPFFYFENNHHWTSLYRQVNRVCADIPRLRTALATLVDETRPIQDRFDEVGGSITGLGKAIMTGILTVAFPDKYGVWNNVSEAGLVGLGIWPEFERGASLGERYFRVNEILLALAKALEIDLWTLDALWWQRSRGDTPPGAKTIDPSDSGVNFLESGQYFGLERHLHDFLFDNWDHIPLGRDWKVYETPGDPEAGYEFACSVGRIDILAHHRAEKKWLVIELKRDDTSDATVGQALRYMGWVTKHLADAGEEVHGLIIARRGDDAVRYAICAVPRLEFMTYEVEFRLKPTNAVDGSSSGKKHLQTAPVEQVIPMNPAQLRTLRPPRRGAGHACTPAPIHP